MLVFQIALGVWSGLMMTLLTVGILMKLHANDKAGLPWYNDFPFAPKVPTKVE